MRSPWLVAVSALALALVLSGCGADEDPRRWEYVLDPVVPAEVAGTFERIDGQSVLTDTVAPLLGRSAASTVVLRADGTFTATNVPDADWRGFVSAVGTWRFAEIDRGFDVVRTIEFEASPSELAIAPARLMGPRVRRWPPRRLAFVLGEPGDGTGVMLGRAGD